MKSLRPKSSSLPAPCHLGILLSALLLSACGGQSDVRGSAPTTQMRAAPSTLKEFTQVRNNYRISKTDQGYDIIDLVGKEGSVSVSADSVLKFSDVTVNLAIGALADSIPSKDLNSLIELYVAFFNRVPDADGLAYWIGQIKQGVSLETIANNFYNAAIIYADQTGYSKDMSEADFVRIVYKNVLGRYGQSAPPEQDVQYWANNLIQKTATKASLISSMLFAAHSFEGNAEWGWVPQLLDNKISTGKYFSVQQGLNYLNPQDSITKGQAIVQAISADGAAQALQLINITDNNFTLSNSLLPGFSTEQLAGQTLSFGKEFTIAFNADGSAKISDRNPNLTRLTWQVKQGNIELKYEAPQVLDYPAGSLKIAGAPIQHAIQETSTGRIITLVSGTSSNGEVKWGETGTVKWTDGPSAGQTIDGSSVGLTTTNQASYPLSVHSVATRLKLDANLFAPGAAIAASVLNSESSAKANVLKFTSPSDSAFLYGGKISASWSVLDNFLYLTMSNGEKMRYSLQSQAADGTQTWLSENLSGGPSGLMTGFLCDNPAPKLDEQLAIHKWTLSNGCAFSNQPKADKTVASSTSFKITWEITTDGALLVTKRYLSNNSVVSTTLYQPLKKLQQQWRFIVTTTNASGSTTLTLLDLIDQG